MDPHIVHDDWSKKVGSTIPIDRPIQHKRKNQVSSEFFLAMAHRWQVASTHTVGA